MSIHCLSHVMRYSEAQLGARLVLFVLAEHAHDDGSEARPAVATIAERTRMSRRAVQSALRRLEETGEIVKDGLGSKGQTQWRVILGGADSAPPVDRGGEVDDVEGAKLTTGGGEAASPEPSFNPSLDPTTTGQSVIQGGWSGVPEEMRRDGEQLLRAKTKVGSRLVTEEEMRRACAALAEFNRQMESEFGIGAWVTQLVGRCRERPSWDEAKLMRLVQSAWRLKWWENQGRRKRADPRVIFGNSRVFEQVALDAKQEAEGTLAAVAAGGDGILKHQIWPDGRSWDELTATEQRQAKESLMMGIEPWKARPESAEQPEVLGTFTSLLDVQ